MNSASFGVKQTIAAIAIIVVLPATLAACGSDSPQATGNVARSSSDDATTSSRTGGAVEVDGVGTVDFDLGPEHDESEVAPAALEFAKLMSGHH